MGCWQNPSHCLKGALWDSCWIHDIQPQACMRRVGSVSSHCRALSVTARIVEAAAGKDSLK